MEGKGINEFMVKRKNAQIESQGPYSHHNSAHKQQHRRSDSLIKKNFERFKSTGKHEGEGSLPRTQDYANDYGQVYRNIKQNFMDQKLQHSPKSKYSEVNSVN